MSTTAAKPAVKPIKTHTREGKRIARKNQLPDGPTLPPFTDAERQLLRKPPTHYDPAFARQMIEDMADGYSFGGFAGKLGRVPASEEQMDVGG